MPPEVYERDEPALMAALEGKTTPQEKVTALNSALLTDRKVEYLSNRYWRDASLAAALLRGRGNCLATSTLYVLVGEEFGLPLRLVLVPRHAYVRWDDGKEHINIETTNKGMQKPDADYVALAACTPEDMTRLRWNDSLSFKDLHAEMLLTVARHRFGQNRLKEGLEYLDKALTLRPDRMDVILERIQMEANLNADRPALILKLRNYLLQEKPPPSLAAQALQMLAAEFNAMGDPARARGVLLTAFRVAPKSKQYGVLTELAFVLRTMRDFPGAQRTMELAVAMRPDDADALYNLAILQRCNEDIKGALQTITKARKLNAESWGLQILEAGYLILDGQRERGMSLYKGLKKPRANEEFYEIMLAWFQAARGDRDAFYKQFARVLSLVRDPQVLTWIKQDVDLDPYRKEPRFRELVRKARSRLLLGQIKPPEVPRAPDPVPAR